MWQLDRLAVEMWYQGIQRGQLSRIIRTMGMSRGQFSLIVNYERPDLRISTLGRLATAMGKHPGELLTTGTLAMAWVIRDRIGELEETVTYLARRCQQLEEELSSTHQRHFSAITQARKGRLLGRPVDDE
jgi:hypothetical protein